MGLSSTGVPRKAWTVSRPEGVPITGFLHLGGGAWRGWLSLWLRKFVQLTILTAIIAVPLMYVYGFSEAALARMFEWTARLGQAFGLAAADGKRVFFDEQLYYYMLPIAPVLEMKFYTWAVCGALFFVPFLTARGLEAILNQPILESGNRATFDARQALYRRGMLLFLLLFLVLGIISILYWLPTVPPESPLYGTNPNSGGFMHSMIAFLQTMFGLVYFLLLHDSIRSRAFVYKIAGLIVAAGTICAAFVIFMQLEPSWLKSFWRAWAEDEHRNNVGSFIGHNTGVSSFLIAPFFLTLATLVAWRDSSSRIVRWSLLSLLLLQGLALFIAQSRAVVPIIIMGIIFFIAMAVRFGSLRVRREQVLFALGILSLLVVSQVVGGKFNPLARTDVPILSRLREFTPQRLQTETRLRIPAVSFPYLVAEAPLIGHAFGSFQYVYPWAQARYFHDHPTSRLALTPHRSFHAHNEYLQVLIELGSFGLLIALAGLGFVLRMGWKPFRASFDAPRIIFQCGILAAIGGYLIHAAADFPLRIAPITLNLVLLLAIWSAGDRLWPAPIATLGEVSDHPTGPVDGAAGASASGRWNFSALLRPVQPEVPAAIPPRRLSAPAHIGTFVGILLFFAFFVGFISVNTLNRWFSGVLLRARGDHYIQMLHEMLAQPEWVGTRFLEANVYNPAAEALTVARYYTPRHGDLYYSQTQLKLIGARVHERYIREYYNAGNSQAAEFQRHNAMKLLDGALSDVTMGLAEFRFHSMYHSRYVINSVYASVDPANQQQHLRAAVHDLVLAYRFNPGFVQAIGPLLQALDRNPSAENEESLRYLIQSTEHFHPSFFQSEVLARVYDSLYLSDYDRADRWMRRVQGSVPRPERYYPVLIATAIRVGDTDRARTLLADAARRSGSGSGQLSMKPAERAWLRVELDIREGDLPRAWEAIRSGSADTKAVPEINAAVISHFLLQQIPDAPVNAKESAAERFEGLIAATGHNLQVAGAIATDIFQDPGLAAPLLRRRYAHQDPPPDLQTIMQLARTEAALGNEDRARELLPELEALADTVTKRAIVQEFRLERPQSTPAP